MCHTIRAPKHLSGMPQNAQSGVCSLSDVQSLNFWGQGLTDISAVATLTNVAVLSLSVNKISQLQHFTACKHLQELYLRKNEVCSWINFRANESLLIVLNITAVCLVVGVHLHAPSRDAILSDVPSPATHTAESAALQLGCLVSPQLQVATVEDVACLCVLDSLRILWLSDNPCAQEPGYRKRVIKMLPALRKLDNVDISTGGPAVSVSADLDDEASVPDCITLSPRRSQQASADAAGAAANMRDPSLAPPAAQANLQVQSQSGAPSVESHGADHDAAPGTGVCVEQSDHENDNQDASARAAIEQSASADADSEHQSVPVGDSHKPTAAKRLQIAAGMLILELAERGDKLALHELRSMCDQALAT